MRKSHNVKAIGQCFNRQTEVFEPEVSFMRALPSVATVITTRHVIADRAKAAELAELVREHFGSIPVFTFVKREVSLDFCLPGELGQRIAS